MKTLRRVLWGVAFIVAGVLLSLRVFGVLNFNVFFDGWWTLFIIVPCIITLITEKGKAASLVGLLIGVAFLLAARGVIDIGIILKLVVPVIIIVVGVRLIFGGLLDKKGKSDRFVKAPKLNNQNMKDYNAMFSAQNIKIDGEFFEGSRMNAVFGGIELDLRGATINHDCIINASAIFGGIDIILPEKVNVKISSNSIFGGISNKRNKNTVEMAPTIYIEGACVFGGMDIK